jgi:hypothetical protein
VVERSLESNADWFVYCAEVHPSYVYKLGDTGFFRELAASSFEVKLERDAARVEFYARPGAKGWLRKGWWPPPPALIYQLKQDAREVPEASDEHYRLWFSDRFYALQNTATGQFIDGGVCD